ncbi:diguanylate cyclase [Salinicola sp. JS01]|uniref:diguanylate cyclase domain-containing protein n=1 Tax=Salinicola sp. JS01 TaxID=3050071 RepID=UPI00255BFEF4|nr:diguanylate cyclase [Salinicola sp. JS01]WIX33410.1 diguanylate cyclase [Salinicola sp. JS01]
MPLVSRLMLYLSLPLIAWALWSGGDPAQHWILAPLLGLLALGQWLTWRSGLVLSRWLLIPTALVTLGIIASFMLSESWIATATWQSWLDRLPGNWPLYQMRPSPLALAALFTLMLNLLLLSRLGLGSPALLLLVAGCTALLSARSLLPAPPHASALIGAPPELLAALWLLWGGQLARLVAPLLRYWQRILPPLAIAGTIMLVVLFGWQQQRQNDNDRLFAQVANDGDRIATLLATETEAHLKAMRRFASFWDMLGKIPTSDEWARQAKLYYEDFGYFRNIAFIDRDGKVLRIYPLRGNLSLIGLNLYRHQLETNAVLDRPLVYGIEGQTGIIDFLQGGRGVISYLPVRDSADGELLGAVGMVVSVDNLLRSLLRQTHSRDRAIMLLDHQQVYFHGGPLANLSDWRYQRPVRIGADTLTLSVQPDLDLLLRQRDRVPEITLVFGLVLAYLVYMVLYVYRRLAQQHRLASQANDSLRHEIAQRERLQGEIEWLARHDELTQLPNRRQLMNWLEEHQQALPLALMICDLDHFKRINDHFGHLTGDRYLATLAESCRATIEAAGGIFARYGGEEFVACVPHCDRQQAKRLAETLRQALAASELVQPDGQPVTLSIGVSVTSGGPLQREALFQAADESLYRAKQNGRDRVEMDGLVL